MLQIPELLAPAGDLERLRYAINYGADAVYCSLPEFGMRSAPANFTPEQLTEGVIYAHARGRKVYLTMNTLPTNEEADRLPDAIKEAAKAGVDAFIVADLGVLDARKTDVQRVDAEFCRIKVKNRVSVSLSVCSESNSSSEKSSGGTLIKRFLVPGSIIPY